MQGTHRLPLVPLLLAGFQFAAFVALVVSAVRLRSLPDPASQFRVYQDLEDAAARITLPTKQGQFGIFSEDARHEGSEVGGRVPGCGTATAAPPESLPLWMLPDDNTGLDGLANAMVRTPLDTRMRDSSSALRWRPV
jgi:hypothetical protein